MKLSKELYLAGVKSLIDAITEASVGMEEAFGIEVKVTCELPEDTLYAAIEDLEKFKAENPDVDNIPAKVFSTADGLGMQVYNVSLLPVPHADVLIPKALAAWVIDIEEEQALIKAVPHTTDENGIVDATEMTPELKASLDACVERAIAHQGTDLLKARMFRVLSVELFKDKEHWEENVAHARAALATEVA